MFYLTIISNNLAPYENITKPLIFIELTMIENTDVLLGRKYIINIYMVFAHAKNPKIRKKTGLR